MIVIAVGARLQSLSAKVNEFRIVANLGWFSLHALFVVWIPIAVQIGAAHGKL